MGSRLPTALSALHSTWTTALAGDSTVAVWYGQVATADKRDAVFVGWNGAPEGEERLGSASSTWAGIGARKRSEDLTIDASILVVTGGDPDDGVTRVFAIHDLCEQALRDDPSLGQGPPFVAAISDVELFQHPHTEGLLTRLALTVTVAPTRT